MILHYKQEKHASVQDLPWSLYINLVKDGAEVQPVAKLNQRQFMLPLINFATVQEK